MFCELGLGVLWLYCKWVDKVTRAVDQAAEQLPGDRVLPAWLDIIFLHLASSHTCNRVVVHMNAPGPAGIESCFRSHCSVINNDSLQTYIASVLAQWDIPCQFQLLDLSEGMLDFFFSQEVLHYLKFVF